ncbi:hypothetical protein ACQ4PT_060903 [Festuca glaucescens]
MWGLVYSDCKHAVQEGTHGVGAPHDSASFNKGNIQNTEVRGLVDTCRNWAVQEGKYGVDTPHESASLNKGNIQNTQVREDSVAVACVVPDAGDTAFQIHCLRRSAYAAVLGAFCAQSDLFSRAKQECLAELRNELKISDTEHREYIVKASTNKHIMSLSLSAWLYKGNNGDAAVVTEFLDLKCVIPDAGGAAFQIHCLERSAYAYVLRAFCAQPNLLPWARLLTKLRNELRLSYIEHQEVIATVSSNAYIKSLRKFSLANYSGLTKKTPAFDLRAVVPDKVCKTGQSFTSLAPESPMPAHTMSPARKLGILGTSYSTTKGPCSDPDNIVPAKKLKSGSGSELAYFKCPPCAEQLPESISSVLLESSKHRPLNSKTSPCAMKAVCAVSPMFQGKHGQSNAGPVPWCVHKGMEASRKRGAEASPVSRSKGLSVAITYSAGNVDHGSDIIKILLTSCLVNKVQELFNTKPDPAMLETAKSILKDQERRLMDALVKLSEVSSASACHVHPAEHDEVTPPPKPGSSSSYDETPTSSITELRRAEAERDVVETRRELEPAAKRTWRPTVRALGSEWVERLSRKRKKRRREECVQ